MYCERDRQFSMDAQRSRRFSHASSPNEVDAPPPYICRNTLAYPVTPGEPTEHTYYLLKENNRNWATLKLYSGAKSSTSLPVYLERENIIGSLEINAERGDSIHSITANVRLSS
jgi:hypothetical protein